MPTAFVGTHKGGQLLPFRYTSRLAIILGQFAINFSGKIDFRSKLLSVLLVGEQVKETRYQFSPFHYHFQHSQYQNRAKKYTCHDKHSPGVEVQSKTPDFAVT